MDWDELFCDVDDFCQSYLPKWRARLVSCGLRKRHREPRLSTSEIMTILVAFHSSQYRTFKHFYLMLLSAHRPEFPNLVSYQRFVELMPRVLAPLCAYLVTRFGEVTGIAFIDSTAIAVCGNKRIARNRVFPEVAEIGRTTMGWFFGFKLHLVINERGELLAAQVTPGNVDDRTPVPKLCRRISGSAYADKGYISLALKASLLDRGLHLVTNIRKNMKNQLLSLWDKLMLRKRSLIETVNDQLKNIAQVEHTRHRSVTNFMVNLIAGLISYTHQPRKPSIRFDDDERAILQLERARKLLVA